MIDQLIYLYGSTCNDEVALTMTLAHELQHAMVSITLSRARFNWAVNSLIRHLPTAVDDLKHLHPLLRKLGLKRGGMHGFRHHRVSTLVMAGTPIEVIKKWVGHSSEEMIRRYTHLRPDFMRDELARVPDFAPKNASKIVEIAPVAPQLAVAV